MSEIDKFIKERSLEVEIKEVGKPDLYGDLLYNAFIFKRDGVRVDGCTFQIRFNPNSPRSLESVLSCLIKDIRPISALAKELTPDAVLALQDDWAAFDRWSVTMDDDYNHYTTHVFKTVRLITFLGTDGILQLLQQETK